MVIDGCNGQYYSTMGSKVYQVEDMGRYVENGGIEEREEQHKHDDH